MAQPPSYNREKNFADDFGNETDHSALNAELDRASNSINDIRTNLAILQADDGKLRPAVVTADSISEELRVSLVEGVVMDAQSMLDKSLVAANASSASAQEAKLSEERAVDSSVKAVNSAKEAAESAKALSLAINADWNATVGPAKILNRPDLSVVATSGCYDDLTGKPDNLATDDDIAVLQEEIAKKGVPVGTVEYFATTTPPAGYLKADGAAVGRETYPDLYAAIGTTFGEGDGSTTFNLPDLIDRFAQGSDTPGQKLEAGLPNISGTLPSVKFGVVLGSASGAFNSQSGASSELLASGGSGKRVNTDFVASRSNPIYGASETVQPPALTLLPCIKAFDAAINPGLIDITELANDVADLSANKLDKTINGAAVKYVIETYNDGANWYRKWSDGWLEQGGIRLKTTNYPVEDFTLIVPFKNVNYYALCSYCSDTLLDSNIGHVSAYQLSNTVIRLIRALLNSAVLWYACGQGE
ncbi:phage tail protein [Oxalobacter formigenes]|nr:phage tail protein [Oxalobacter formigenes]ARQ46311.1 Phage Tail Collar Domain protein [Oxalobacter formigenes]MCZ4062996.1 tail fiber protein [Oxalobacter formigenes]QDX34155.1 phage tail protein [Oxalobacter formigenes]WAW02593.1 tail fiber protein [Oxalobacter formigenes]WAW04774.1 tail fiber protein [Oxalobacter formigenes]